MGDFEIDVLAWAIIGLFIAALWELLHTTFKSRPKAKPPEIQTKVFRVPRDGWKSK